MPRLDESFADLVRALRAQFGSPGELSNSATGSVPWFERLARVALDQVASPRVATAALDALRDAGLLEPATLGVANPLAIDDVLKDARVAVALRSLRPLQKLARWAAEQDLPPTESALADRSTESLRDDWRAINGIGPALAENLLLFGVGRPSYPVDRATFRILVRHGWLEPDAEYDEARATIERHAGRAGSIAAADHASEQANLVALLTDLAFWFEKVGRDHCKPTRPKCEQCTLRPWLPPSGPVEVE